VAISYFPNIEKSDETKAPYLNNFIRTKKIGNKILVTTDMGSWVALSRKEYDLLRLGKIKNDSELYELLENRGIILTEKNTEDVIQSYMKRKRFLFQGTSLHIVVPTLRCNHRCIYCHSKARGQNEKGFDMDEETAKKTVDFIFQTPVKNISIEFQGGEPLLNFPIVKYIVEYAKKMNETYKKKLKFAIVTNLTLMNDDIARYLISNKVGICTSLDGIKKVHDKNRKYIGGSSYEKIAYWTRRLIEEYDFTPHALCVVTKHSLPYLKEIIDNYVKLGIKKIWFKCANNLGYAQEVWDEIGCTPEEYFDFWRKGLDYLTNNKLNIIEVVTYYLLKKVLNEEDPLYLDLQSPCGAAIGQLAYDQKGNIYTCDEARMFDEFKLGNVKKDSYKDILTSPKTCSIVAASTNDTLLCDACVWKPYCGVCPVCTYATRGTLITQLPLDYRCKILKKQFNYIFEKMLSDKKYLDLFMKWSQTGIFK